MKISKFLKSTAIATAVKGKGTASQWHSHSRHCEEGKARRSNRLYGFVFKSFLWKFERGCIHSFELKQPPSTQPVIASDWSEPKPRAEGVVGGNRIYGFVFKSF